MNLSAGYKSDEIFYRAVSTGVFIEEDIESVLFIFASGNSNTSIIFNSNGTGSYNGSDFTYTYSNGHYVITSTGSGGVEPGA